MKTYLINQDLPEKYKSVIKRFGRCVPLPPSDILPPPVGSHPDTLIGKIGDEIFVGESDVSLRRALDAEKIKYRVSAHAAAGKYPLDCALNFFTVKNMLFGKTDTMSADAAKFAEENGYEMIYVRQGYAHCATALVGGGAITSDDGIFDALTLRGVPSLKITSGNILLPPYKYGFIGGAGGVVNDNTVIFFGSLSFHPDGEKIRKFCSDMRVRIIEGDGPLYDYGGMITLDI